MLSCSIADRCMADGDFIEAVEDGQDPAGVDQERPGCRRRGGRAAPGRGGSRTKRTASQSRSDVVLGFHDPTLTMTGTGSPA